MTVANKIRIAKFLKAANDIPENVNTFWSDLVGTAQLKISSYSTALNFLLLKYFIKKINKIPRTNYLMSQIQEGQFQISIPVLRLFNQWEKQPTSTHFVQLSCKLTDKQELELFYALRTLHNFGILENAMAFFLENRIEITFVNLRHYFYSQQIIDSLRYSGKKLNILEIGGGGEFTNYFKASA